MSSGDFLRDKLSEGVLSSVYNMYNSDALCQIVDKRADRERRPQRENVKKTRENPPTDSCPPAGVFYE